MKETITVDKKKFENALDYIAHGKHEFIGTNGQYFNGRERHMKRVEILRKRLGVINEN